MKTSGAIVSDDRPWQKKNHLIKKQLRSAAVKSTEDDASSGREVASATSKDDINVGDVLAELVPIVIDSRDESSLIVNERSSLDDESTEKKREDPAPSREGTSKLDDDISVEWAEIVGTAPTIRVNKSPITTPSIAQPEKEEEKEEVSNETSEEIIVHNNGAASTVEEIVREDEIVEETKADSKADRLHLKSLRQSSKNLTKALSSKLNSIKKTQDKANTDTQDNAVTKTKRKSIKPQMSMPKMLKRESKKTQKKEKKQKSASFGQEEEATSTPQKKTSGYGDAMRVGVQKIRGMGTGMKKKASVAGSHAKKLFSCKKQREEIVYNIRTIPTFSSNRGHFEPILPTVRRRPMAVKIHMRPKRRGSEVQRLREAKKQVVVHTVWIRKLMKNLEGSLDKEVIDGSTKPDSLWVHKLLDALEHLEKRIDSDVFEDVKVESESPKRMYLVKLMQEIFEEERRLYPISAQDGRMPRLGWMRKLLVALKEESHRIEGHPIARSPEDEEKSQTTWVRNMVGVLEVEQIRAEHGLSKEQEEDAMLLSAWVKRVARALEEEDEAFKEENPTESDPKLVATWIVQMTDALEEDITSNEEFSEKDEDLKPATQWMEEMLEEMEKEEKEAAAEEARLAILNSRSKWMAELLDFMDEADLHLGAVLAKKHWVWIKNMVSAIDEEETVTKEMLPDIHEPIPEDDKTTLSFPISLVTPSVVKRSTSLIDATHSQHKVSKEALTNIHQPVPQDDQTTITFHSSMVSPTIVKRSKKQVIAAPNEPRREEEEDVKGTAWLWERLHETCCAAYRTGGSGAYSVEENTTTTPSLADSALEEEGEDGRLETIVSADTEKTEKN